MKTTILAGLMMMMVGSQGFAATITANQALSGAYSVVDSVGCAAIHASSASDIVVLATAQSISIGDLYSYDIGTVTSAPAPGFFNEFETAYVSSYSAERAQFTAVQEIVDRLNPANPTFAGQLKLTLTGNVLQIDDSLSRNGQPGAGPLATCQLNKLN